MVRLLLQSRGGHGGGGTFQSIARILPCHLKNVESFSTAEGLPSPLSSSRSMETHMERQSPVQTCRVQAPHPPGMGLLQGYTQSLPGVFNDTSSMAREVHGHQGVIRDTLLQM